MGVNPVGTWLQPNFQEANDGTSYKTALDNSIRVATRIADAFACHERPVPDLNVVVNPGGLMIDVTLTEKAEQVVGPFTAPTVNPRIDRIVIDALTGDAEVIAGAEGASPTAPAIPDEKLPVAQIALSVGQTIILNANITDERLGNATSVVSIKDRSSGVTTVENTVTETAIFTYTVPGGLLGATKSLFLFLECSELDMVNGPETLTIRLKYGSTTLAAAVLTSDVCAPVANAVLAIEARLHAFGGAGFQLATLTLKVGAATVGNPALDVTNAFKLGVATEDSTGDLNLVVTAQFSIATNVKLVMSRVHLRKE